MITLVRTDSSHPDFVALVRHLDKELAAIYGESQAFYDQFNKINMIRHVVLAYDDDKPVACGAIKEYSNGVMEVKRMYTLPEYRSKGIAAQVLAKLENWAASLGYDKCILETGDSQPYALRLYEKCGYKVIPNYGQYAGMGSSICFEKSLNPDLGR